MKHIMVSGCARGIGEAVVRKFLSEGYCVTGMSRTDGEAVKAKFLSDRFEYYQGDLSNAADREGFVKKALSSF